MKHIASLLSVLISLFSFSQQCSITATDAGNNTTANYSCGTGGSITLKTTEPTLIYGTDDYEAVKQNYDTSTLYNTGTALGLGQNNKFSGVIKLPFPFCFYNKTYKELIISTNGYISFDTSLANQGSNPYTDPNWTIKNLSEYLPNNAIFGVKQALDYTKGGEVYYDIIGTAPCRKFVISFYNAALLNCPGNYTSQIVLHEFTNEIEVNIGEKPACSSATFKMSLMGIINADHTKGLAPPSRDTGEWDTANESWKFQPKGNKINPMVVWKNSAGQIVSRSNPFSLYPIATDTYTVSLTYNLCSGSYVFSDDILLIYSTGGGAPTTPPDLVDIPRTICDNNADGKEDFDFQKEIKPKLVSDNSLVVTYHKSQQEADSGVNPVNYVQNGSYILYARITNSTGCYTTAKVYMNITFYDKVEAKDITKIYCFDGTSDFLGEDLRPYTTDMLISLPSEIKKTLIYDTYDKAFKGTDPDTPIVDITDDIVGNDMFVSKDYFVRFENSNGCYTIKKLTVRLYKPKVQKSDIDICKNDGNSSKNLHDYDVFLAPSPIKVTYFDPNDPTKVINTFNFTDPITEIDVQLDIPDVVPGKGDCKRNAKIKFFLNQPPKLKNTAPLVLDLKDKTCDNNNDDQEKYPLSPYHSYFYVSMPADFVTFSYYEKYNPSNQSFSNPVPEDYVLRKDKDSYHIYVKVSSGKGCFSVGEIFITNKFLPAVVLQPGLLEKCGPNGLGYDVIFDLNDKAIDNMFDKTQNTIPLSDIKKTFYDNEEDANEHPDKNIGYTKKTKNQEETIWARFEDIVHGCYSVKPLVLRTKYPIVPQTPAPIAVCDNNLDGKPDINLFDYTNQMTAPADANPANIFRFYKSPADLAADKPIPNPENYEPDSLPKTIHVRVESLPGCYDNKSNAQVNLIQGTKTSINPGSYKISVCDDGTVNEQDIDITQFENTMFPGANFNYFRSLNDLNLKKNEISGDKTKHIYKLSDGPNLYVKVTAAGFCPELVIIPVELKKVPEFKLSPYYFCPAVGTDISLKDVRVADIVDHSWKFPDGTFSKEETIEKTKIAGTYALTITTKNLCSYTNYFDVVAYEVPVIRQLIPIGSNGYQVIATGSKKILYSIDGIHFQESNIFENINPGPVKFYVRFDDRDCIGEIKKALSVKIPNVISPNNDGVNDFWTIENLDSYDQPSEMKIYDRNGILIFEQTSGTSLLWDGKISGRPLPSSTYWYKVKFPDKEFSGWILLKNRE